MLVILDDEWTTGSLLGSALVKELSHLNIRHALASHMAQHLQQAPSSWTTDCDEASSLRSLGSAALFCSPESPIGLWQRKTPLLLAKHRQLTGTELMGRMLTLKPASPLSLGLDLDDGLDFVETGFSFHFMEGTRLLHLIQQHTLINTLESLMQMHHHMARAASMGPISRVTLGLIGLAHAQTQSRRAFLTRAQQAASEPLSEASLQSIVNEKNVQEALVQVQLAFPAMWITNMKTEIDMIEWLLEFIRVVTNLPTK